MIKNDRQYRITKAAATKFEQSLNQLASKDIIADESVHPMIQEAERNAMRSQLDELQGQLREYEDLVAGKVGIIEANSIAELPDSLIRARIVSGLSQKDLAERLGMKEQQIQRYEATDYRQASLARLMEIAKALNVGMRKEIFLPQTSAWVPTLFNRFKDIGLTKDFVLSRLVPQEAAARFLENATTGIDRVAFSAIRAMSHIFGWTPAAIVGQDRPWLDNGVLGAARFKVNAAAEEKYLSVYTFYAHFLTLLLLKATEGIPAAPVPTNPDEVRTTIEKSYGELSLQTALNYCWDLGIPVLPLNDPGAFHGAFWRIGGRNVIILKQRTSSLARWLFDLMHEFRHAGEEPQNPSREIIEESETSPSRLNSEEEKDASWFAGEVVLDGKAEELVARCVTLAQNDIPRLKSVVQQVAKEANVSVDSLANYLAFRMSLQKQNWWGTAANLQSPGPNPVNIAREILLKRVNLARLNGIDRELFIQALQDSEV